MFHATDGSGGREFREEWVHAATLEEAVAAAVLRAVEPPGMRVSSATLADPHDRLVWFALPQAVEGQGHQPTADPDAAAEA